MGGGVEVGILGPTVVRWPEGTVDLPARTERAVVSALAAREGRAASLSALIADVWGDHAAEARLVVAVSRLRARLERALGPAGRAVVETLPAGYRLAAAGVDATRFADLVGEGRAQLAGGDPAGAARSFDGALDLWRGDPLPDAAPTATVQAVVARLGALRDTAVDARTDASLALGENDGVIARVEALLVDDPFREARWAQLMLALYRSGRQADALRCYQRARDVLTEALGIEPGPELQRLEAAVLAHDPALDRRITPPAPTGGVRSAFARRVVEARWIEHQRELPLVGREGELDQLLGDFACLAEGRGGVVVVEGDPGVGKTRLAAELAHRVRLEGGEVLRAACAPGAGLVSLMPWAAGLGFDLPDAGPGSAALNAFAFDVADHLATVTDRPPTLLVLDDAQWADPQTVALLVELGDRPLPVPDAQRVLALVLLQRGADRPTGWARLLSTISRLGLHRRIELGPVGAGDARTIVSAVLGAEATPTLVARITADAGGNAEALVALARAAAAEARPEPAAPAEPAALAEAFGGRLDCADADVGAVVLAASVLADPCPLDDVVAAVALPEEVVLAALERAVAGRLLDAVPGGDGPTRFAFRFPLERRLAAARVSPARRARIEGRVGR